MKITTFARLSLTLGTVFFGVIIMTSWWLWLFAKSLDAYVQSELYKLEKNMLIAVYKDNNMLKSLLDSGKIIQTTSCSATPCVQLKNKNSKIHYQIRESYLLELQSIKHRKVNMLTWETSFLMIILLISIAYLIWVVYREKLAQQEKREFLALTTHELKHPISVISLLLESLKRNTLPPERKEEFIDKGLAEVRDFKNSLEGILKIQELDFQKNDKVTPYFFKDYIENLVVSWKLNKLNNPERIILNKTNSIDSASITTNPKLIDMVMNNLLENALLYSSDDVYLNAGTDNKGLFIEVIDKGLGFSEEEKKSYDKMFFRSSRHEVQNVGGTGLGHFIIKKIIMKTGMSIFLDSKGPNQGSIFRLMIK